MPILYSVIARGTVVLAKYASCAGNFAEVTEQFLSKIAPTDDQLTYFQGNYLFHYISANRMIYFCITDDQFERRRAFLYLYEIQRRFNASFADTATTAIAYAMNSEFSRVLAAEIKHYSESRDIDSMSRVHGELDNLKNIMVKNIDNVTSRGERLELLVSKTDSLTNNSVSYRNTSRNLARSMFWKNIKLYVILSLVVIVIVYFIISMACGGLAWKSCVG